MFYGCLFVHVYNNTMNHREPPKIQDKITCDPFVRYILDSNVSEVDYIYKCFAKFNMD